MASIMNTTRCSFIHLSKSQSATCGMHYSSRAGSLDGDVVLQPLKGPLVGTNRALSAGDIKKMQIIGQCSGWRASERPKTFERRRSFAGRERSNGGHSGGHSNNGGRCDRGGFGCGRKNSDGAFGRHNREHSHGNRGHSFGNRFGQRGRLSAQIRNQFR